MNASLLAKKKVHKHNKYEYSYIVFFLVQLGLINRGGSGKEQTLSGGGCRVLSGLVLEAPAGLD